MLGVTATFGGYITTGYMQYLDLGTGHTLVAAPGGTYSIAIASGWEALAAIPADGFWEPSSLPAAATLTAVPGAPEPGAFYPGSPGPVSGGDMSVLDERTAEEVWAEGVVAAADPIYGEIRDRLASAGEKLAVLRRQQGRKPG